MTKAVTERVGLHFALQRTFLYRLRGMRQNKRKMAPEQRTESAVRIRLRQVPPVTADRVTDPKRPVL